MNRSSIITAAAIGVGLCVSSSAQATVIISDNFTAPAETTDTFGFALDQGVNRAINPPTSTRLTGTVSSNLRYINVGPKNDTSYQLHNNGKMRANNGSQSGRVSISDGTMSGDAVPVPVAYDFGPALGTGSASAANPLVYDITISMDNNAPSTSTAKMSFALGTVEGSAGVWDFGLQLARNASGDTTYTTYKRFDNASTGLASDTNAIMTALSVTAGNEVDFLIRVTDAGAQSGSNYNSRVQVSINGGTTWMYDTAGDSSLTNGFRFDGTGRFISFDVAQNNGNFVAWDNFSITTIPEPGTMGLAAAAGMMVFARRRKA